MGRRAAGDSDVFMTTTSPPTIIRSPVCASNGAMLHHDIRASLIYSCENCTHEWQIDPAEEPQQADTTVAERPRTPSTSAEKRHTP